MKILGLYSLFDIERSANLSMPMMYILYLLLLPGLEWETA